LTKLINSTEPLQKELAALTNAVDGLRTELGQGFSDIETSTSLGELRHRGLDRELESLRRHVRGLDTTVREGFAKMTELLTKEPAS
jgi:hypothetical protein